MEYKWFMVILGFNYFAAEINFAIQQRGIVMGYYSSIEEAQSHVKETPESTYPYLFIDYNESRECDWYEIINLKDGVY